MASISDLKVNLLLDTSGFASGISEATSKVKGFSSDAVGGLQNIGKVGLMAVAGGLTAGVGVLGAAIGTATVQAGSFQQALANVGAVSRASDDDMARLRATAMEMGAKTAFSATQAAEAMYFLSSAGFNTNQMISTMPGLLSLAAATATDLGTAADITSNILSGFNMSVDETQIMVDTMAATVSKANTNLPMLGEAMKYVAPVASSLGFSIYETSAALGKLADAGIQAGQSGTVLRSIMSNLASPTGATTKAFSDLNLNLLNTDGTMKSLPEVIGLISSSMDGMTDVQKAAYAEMLVGKEAMSGLLILMNQGEEGLAAFSEELENSGGIAAEMASDQMNTFQGAMTSLKGSIETVVLELGSAFLPMGQKVAEFGIDWVNNSILPIIKAFGEWLPQAVDKATGIFNTMLFIWENTGSVVDTLSVGLTALLTALGFNRGEVVEITNRFKEFATTVEGYVSQAITFVTENLGAFKGALMGVAVAVGAAMAIGSIVGLITALVNPLTIVIAAAALLGAAWSQNWGDIQGKTKAVIDFVVPYVERGIAAVTAFWSEHGDNIIASVVQFAGTVQRGFETFITGVRTIVTNGLAAIRRFWAENGDTIIATVQNTWNGIKGIVEHFTGLITNVIGMWQSARSGEWYQFGQHLRQNWDATLGAVLAAFEQRFGVLGRLFEVWQGATQVGWKAFLVAILRAVTEKLIEMETAFKTGLINLTKAVGSGLVTLDRMFREGVAKFIKIFRDTNWSEVGSGIISGIVNGIKSGLGALESAAKQAAKSALDAAKGFLGINSPSKAFATIGQNVISGFVRGLSQTNQLERAAINVAGIVNKLAAPEPISFKAEAVSVKGHSSAGTVQRFDSESPSIIVNINRIDDEVDIRKMAWQIWQEIERLKR